MLLFTLYEHLGIATDNITPSSSVVYSAYKSPKTLLLEGDNTAKNK